MHQKCDDFNLYHTVVVIIAYWEQGFGKLILPVIMRYFIFIYLFSLHRATTLLLRPTTHHTIPCSTTPTMREPWEVVVAEEEEEEQQEGCTSRSQLATLHISGTPPSTWVAFPPHMAAWLLYLGPHPLARGLCCLRSLPLLLCLSLPQLCRR